MQGPASPLRDTDEHCPPCPGSSSPPPLSPSAAASWLLSFRSGRSGAGGPAARSRTSRTSREDGRSPSTRCDRHTVPAPSLSQPPLHCSHNPAGQGASSAPHGRWGGSHAGRCSERLARGARLARKQAQGPSTGTDDSGRAQCPEESQTAVPALARTPPFGAALFTRAEGWARL